MQQAMLEKVRERCIYSHQGKSHQDSLMALPPKTEMRLLVPFLATMKKNFMHALLIVNEESDLKWIDDPLIATGFSFNLVKAFSMNEALELMTSICFDIVMYDVNFSQDNMSDHLKQISYVRAKTPIVVLTNHLGDPLAKQALSAGVNYHLVKDHHNLGLMVESLKSFLKAA